VSLRGRTALTTLVALAAAAVLAGCGLGAGHGAAGVTVTVTKDFGAGPVGTATESKVPGSETVMRTLERTFHVTTRYGGGFVQSIDGLTGSAEHDWFYYVNGVQAAKGAATTPVHSGDSIWWDFHDWRATETIPAVVGAFPEPFVHGIGGKRYPTTLECASGVQTACTTVANAFAGAGVAAATQFFGTGSGTDSLNVLVAPWGTLRSALVADLLEHGPSISGIYAKFGGPGGRELELLNPSGHAVKALGAGAGLLAATADNSGTPTWLVTGTDAAGVAAAARALRPGILRHRFAVAVQGGMVYPLPLEPAQ
jgi:hypothetical protein